MFIRDMYRDGIEDDYEVQNISRMNIPYFEWYGILHSKDYDQDNLPDGYEIRMFYWAFTHSKDEYLNVSDPSDASLDFDSDGLTNIEEYERDPSGDYDHDGLPDIYDSEDDNDGIPTSVELQYHLDPFNPSDANGDLDYDGLTNLFEYQHNLSIQDADTDHDSIDDGAELHYWNVTRGLDIDTSIAYCKNPDVDGDNITDCKDIYGYEVKIIT